MKKELTEKPEAIMINIPEAFFKEKSEDAFRRYYEGMGHPGGLQDATFYHWISTVPKHNVTHVYVCFKGRVQYKAILVEKIKNESPFDGWEQRDYVVTTGPVIKAPVEMVQRGFRGFRYTKHLF
jgi:hypothetical protein